jgi:FixJ family two-component response regulator
MTEYGITSRELDLIRVLALGRSNKEISSELGVSVHTVRNHIHSNSYRSPNTPAAQIQRYPSGASPKSSEIFTGRCSLMLV